MAVNGRSSDIPNDSSRFLLKSQKSFAKLIARTSQPWQEIPQPVQLVNLTSTLDPAGSVRYVCDSLTRDAKTILSQLSAPLNIVAFTGFGRTGKSSTASLLRHYFTPHDDVRFCCASGNLPCTHGIDMMVFPHPDAAKGHLIFLDCEGGGNHNQSALPFVIGLAARLSSMIYVFERGCFTTNGLDTVMQIVNMGGATSKDPNSLDITRHLVLCENMSINNDIPSSQLKADLLSQLNGDEQTNRVRKLIQHRFDVDFVKIPYCVPENAALYNKYNLACNTMAKNLADTIQPFKVGDVLADGPTILQLASTLVEQIKSGGSRYCLVSATEAMVGNMATEAANAIWTDFIHKTRKAGLHPSQITGRKHLKTITREIEGISNTCLIDLESFTLKLYPREPALVANLIWETNLVNFIRDVKTLHEKKASNIAKYTAWTYRLNGLITDIIGQSIGALGQFVKFARFSTSLIVMSNFYIWKRSLGVLVGFATDGSL